MQPMMKSRMAMAEDEVMTEPIARAASRMLSANISLTTRAYGKAVVGGALIEMGAMRRPERFAPGHTPQQGDGGVSEIIERQQQRSCEVLMPGELQQAPAGQQADRQAADVAEKDFRDRAVEGREAEHRPEQRRGSDCHGRRKFDEPAEQNERTGDGHDLGHRHQIQPVHEVDEVHEPQACEQQQAAFDPERTGGSDPQVFRRGQDHRGDREPLQQQPRHHRDGTDVIGKAHGRDEQRRAEYHDGNFHLRRAGKGDDRNGRDQRGRDHRDARALRRRNPMGRARIRPCQRYSHQQRPDRPCQGARQQRRRHCGGKRQQ